MSQKDSKRPIGLMYVLLAKPSILLLTTTGTRSMDQRKTAPCAFVTPNPSSRSHSQRSDVSDATRVMTLSGSDEESLCDSVGKNLPPQRVPASAAQPQLADDCLKRAILQLEFGQHILIEQMQELQTKSSRHAAQETTLMASINSGVQRLQSDLWTMGKQQGDPQPRGRRHASPPADIGVLTTHIDRLATQIEQLIQSPTSLSSLSSTTSHPTRTNPNGRRASLAEPPSPPAQLPRRPSHSPSPPPASPPARRVTLQAEVVPPPARLHSPAPEHRRQRHCCFSPRMHALIIMLPKIRTSVFRRKLEVESRL